MREIARLVYGDPRLHDMLEVPRGARLIGYAEHDLTPMGWG